jgi:hypothetical protein
VSADGCFHDSGVAFRKRLYDSIEDLQDDLDLWVKSYNEERPERLAEELVPKELL